LGQGHSDMTVTFEATQVEVGFHPDVYRIDRTASAMNRYTKWEILAGSKWANPTPVCFDGLPQKGWIKRDRFDWNTNPMESVA
jgi:hypothetical protein